MVLKIVVAALICVFLSSSLKTYSSEFSCFVSVAGGVIIFLLCIDELEQVILYLKELYSFASLSLDYFDVVLKIVGVGYITEFTADIAEDFGNKNIASKVILGGKIVICTMSIPIIKSLLTVLLSLLS